MIAPLSWLKKYITISLKPEELGEHLTEVGLGTERIKRENNDIIFDLEITPNRPDWLSIMGVAREIAAIEGKKVTYPELKTDLKPKKSTKLLPLKIHPNYTITPRLTGIIINNVEVKDSPEWLQDHLLSIGQKPINNIVDITNFVMWELGNPIHSFDYHKITGHEMWVKQAKGGERFESVDEISYHLPKGAIIYEDSEKIFDLVGIKGGKNSGTYKDTKAVFIVVEVDDPVLIRRASLALGLRSDASAIFERAVNKGGTIDALKRTVDLILETAGGEIASQLIDLKEQEFKPWKLQLRLSRLTHILGITIPEKEVVHILDKLSLSPKILKADTIECTIPTYRNDLQIEEDLIEEVARLYGYNNFPHTMPVGQIPIAQVPYFRDFRKDEAAKKILQAGGFSEVYTYSLLSESDLDGAHINSEYVLRVDNPVSRDFEYLRPTLKTNLLKALQQNKGIVKDVHLFELGKVYEGKSLDDKKEIYHLAGISNTKSYTEIKGLLERLFSNYAINKNPSEYMEVLEQGVYFDIPYGVFETATSEKIFQPIPKFPPIMEDMSIEASGVSIGDIMKNIKSQSSLITDVTLLDQYKNSLTFHIVYQHQEKNLTSDDVKPIREKIIASLEKNFSAKIK